MPRTKQRHPTDEAGASQAEKAAWAAARHFSSRAMEFIRRIDDYLGGGSGGPDLAFSAADSVSKMLLYVNEAQSRRSERNTAEQSRKSKKRRK